MITALQKITSAMPDSAHPKELAEAYAFESAIVEMLAKAQAVEPLNPAAITTAAEAKKAIDAAVARDVGNEPRIRHLNTLVAAATARVEAAQQASASSYREAFRKEFDTAAKRLYAILAEHGHIDPATVETGNWNYDPALADLRETLAELARLGTIRDAYALLAGRLSNPPVSIPYEQNSRVAIFDNNNIQQRFNSDLHSAQRFGPLWFITAAQADGVRLKWQDPDEQHAQPEPANNARAHAALAAQNAGH